MTSHHYQRPTAPQPAGSSRQQGRESFPKCHQDAGAAPKVEPPRQLRALVACEYSGRVREALRARGIGAVSCDLEPAEDDSPHHVQGDVLAMLKQRWDLVIAHPPCTYLANSGVRWLTTDASRWPKLFDAAEFFLACLNANAPRVAVENPVMHKYGRRLVGRGHDFTVQPWQFGDDETKRTCFWTRGLFPLRPTSDLDGSTAVARVHLETPGPQRWKERSRTPQGLADAIADQWGAPDLMTYMEAAE